MRRADQALRPRARRQVRARSCSPTRTYDAVIPALAPSTLPTTARRARTRRACSPRASGYREVVEALREQIGAYPVGDPADLTIAIGPLVGGAQRERVDGYIDTGRDEGARLVLDGGRADRDRG